MIARVTLLSLLYNIAVKAQNVLSCQIHGLIPLTSSAYYLGDENVRHYSIHQITISQESHSACGVPVESLFTGIAVILLSLSFAAVSLFFML